MCHHYFSHHKPQDRQVAGNKDAGCVYENSFECPSATCSILRPYISLIFALPWTVFSLSKILRGSPSGFLALSSEGTGNNHGDASD